MQISELSNSDVICIKAHFEYIYRLQCNHIIEERIRSGYTREIATEAISAQNGCNIMSDEPVYQIDSIQYHTCPCNYRHPNMDFFVCAQEAYEKGILPFPGSLIDQPAYIMEAILLIQGMLTEYRAEEQEKANKRNK